MLALGLRYASAQQPTGIATVDSASVARAAWGRATKALFNHQIDEARQEVKRAAGSWPVQPAYVWAEALLAARAGDTATTLNALSAYASLGLGRPLRAESAFAPYVNLPAFAGVIALHNANGASMVRSRAVGRLADSTFWPEGVDYDPRTRHFYVASVRYGTIAEIRPNGETRELLPRNSKAVGAVLGVRVDTTRGVIWATTSGIAQMANYVPADSAIAALLRLRISDGVIERRWDLPVIPRGHVLGDLAVGPNGDVFVTDSNDPVLYRLRPGADTLESIRHPLFRSLQGMAPTPDDGALYVADYSHGILRVNLAAKTVIRLDDASGSTSLGCDGIIWDRGAIVAVQNGIAPAPSRIMRFVLSAAGDRIARATVLDQNFEIADEPTIGTIAGGEFVYVANSQWEKYDASMKRVSSKPLTGPRLLAVPLTR